MRNIITQELRSGGYDRLPGEVADLQSHVHDRRWNTFIESYLRDASEHLHSIESKTEQAVEQLWSELSGIVEAADRRGIHVEEHLRGVEEHLRGLELRIHELLGRFGVLSSRIRALPYQDGSLVSVSQTSKLQTLGFNRTNDARGLVDVFRPPFDKLVSELAYLLDFLPTGGTGVDLGAGRGEMVKVLLSKGVDAFGIDIDQSVVSEARTRGVEVRLAEIGSFLDSCRSGEFNVVTAIQVVEHVDRETLLEWLRIIEKVLQPGGVLVVETPNPHAIDAFKAFWVDTTHVRPYYPESLLLMVHEVGFERAEIVVKGDQWAVHDRLEFADSYALIATKSLSNNRREGFESENV